MIFAFRLTAAFLSFEEDSPRQKLDLEPLAGVFGSESIDLSNPKERVRLIAVSLGHLYFRDECDPDTTRVAAAIAKNGGGNGWLVHGEQYGSHEATMSTWKKSGNLVRAFDEFCGQLTRVPLPLNQEQIRGVDAIKTLLSMAALQNRDDQLMTNESRERRLGYRLRADYLNQVTCALRIKEIAELIEQKTAGSTYRDTVEDFLYNVIGVNENEKWQLLAVLGYQPSEYGCDPIDEEVYMQKAKNEYPF